MSRFLLDTDTINLAQFGHPVVLAHLASHSISEIAIPVISFQEQMDGWLSRLPRLKGPQQLQDWYDRLVDRLFPVWRKYDLVSFRAPAVLRFEHLLTLKLNVGKMDLRIAAIAIESALIVVTRNLRDFRRVPGVAMVDWSI